MSIIDFSKIYTSRNSGPFRIIDYIGFKGTTEMVKIRFINPNIFGIVSEQEVSLYSVNHGSVSDPYELTMYDGNACKGNAITYLNGKHLKEYNLWSSMVLRISKSNNKYSIDDRWRCYEFFLNDIKSKDNYNEWLNNNGEYMFVKDPRSNIYSYNTTYFIKSFIAIFINTYTPGNIRGVKEVNGKYKVEFNNNYYGVYTNKIAAANIVNYVLINIGVPNFALNDVPKMTVEEANKYRVAADDIPSTFHTVTNVVETINKSNRNSRSSSDDISGERFENNGDPFVIVIDHRYDKSFGSRRTVDIKFIKPNIFGFNTERKEIRLDRILANKYIKDYYQPNVHGVACFGNVSKDIERNNTYIRSYKCWNDMIRRCYDVNDYHYKWYGELGVTVEKRWLCFEYFLNDIKLLPGYDEWLNNPGTYQLDKDSMQQNIPVYNKIYSRETCCFIPVRNNIQQQRFNSENRRKYIGVEQKSLDKYKCSIGHKYYGSYTNPIAAASMYNIVARYRGCDENYINQLNYEMPINEIRKYRNPCQPITAKDGSKKYLMYRILDPKNESKDSSCEIIININKL